MARELKSMQVTQLEIKKLSRSLRKLQDKIESFANHMDREIVVDSDSEAQQIVDQRPQYASRQILITVMRKFYVRIKTMVIQQKIDQIKAAKLFQQTMGIEFYPTLLDTLKKAIGDRCSECEFIGNNDLLLDHLLDHFPEIQLFICVHCNQSYQDLDELQEHLKIHVKRLVLRLRQ